MTKKKSKATGRPKGRDVIDIEDNHLKTKNMAKNRHFLCCIGGTLCQNRGCGTRAGGRRAHVFHYACPTETCCRAHRVLSVSHVEHAKEHALACRNPVSEVFNSISSESESDEFQKEIKRVSEVEFRGFDFRHVIEWGRVSSFEKLDKKGCFEESSSETSSEVEFLTKVWHFWLQLKSGLQVFVVFCRTKHERRQTYSY